MPKRFSSNNRPPTGQTLDYFTRDFVASIHRATPSQTKANRAKPSAKPRPIAICIWTSGAGRKTSNRAKPSAKPRPITICIWTLRGAALTSIIILFKRKDGPNRPAPATSNYILEFYQGASAKDGVNKPMHDFLKNFWRTAVEFWTAISKESDVALWQHCGEQVPSVCCEAFSDPLGLRFCYHWTNYCAIDNKKINS